MSFTYESPIAQNIIEPSMFRMITRQIFGWIPIYGQLFELPLNIGAAILPPLPSVSHPNLPKDGEWNDPKVLKGLKSIRVAGGYIRVVPVAERKNERGEPYKPERCWLELFHNFECPDVELDDFLSEIRVYLTFQDVKQKESDPTVNMQLVDKEHEILLAWSDLKEDYSKEKKQLNFNVTNENLRPYLDYYGSFDIRIAAKGKYPRFKAYIDGKVFLDLQLRLAPGGRSNSKEIPLNINN